ncbi:MAG: Hpt domain-containing protein [Candidatus Aminicenantes bacterium]|nr:MAG: Hpt domain-containing protein [Candidatus Aminicenantes bacterium]
MSENNHPKKDISPIDFSSLLERVGGDKSLLKELLDLYLEEFSEKHAQLRAAIQQNKFDLILELGHNLKGSSANLSLIFLQDASFQMETAGREGDIEKAKKALSLLEEEFKKLRDFLSSK